MISFRMTGLIAIACTLGTAHAQFAAQLSMNKKNHLIGETVMATLTVTNHSGQEQTFRSDGRVPWLSLMVKTSNGSPLSAKSAANFGPMKIAPGQSLAREIDISRFFHLSRPGNFSASAVIRNPGREREGTSTNRAFFNQSSGRIYWNQKVGMVKLNEDSSGTSKHIREYRLLNFTGDDNPFLYLQIEDVKTGRLVATFSLGRVLMMRKPVATVDKNQTMHVLFLTTPTFYAHYAIDADGNVETRELHKRASTGEPQLVTMPDGSVDVANSIPYDPELAAKQRAEIHKITDRPEITY